MGLLRPWKETAALEFCQPLPPSILHLGQRALMGRVGVQPRGLMAGSARGVFRLHRAHEAGLQPAGHVAAPTLARKVAIGPVTSAERCSP